MNEQMDNLNGARGISLFKNFHPLGPTKPPFQRVPGFLPGLKRLAHDINQSPQSGAKVKNE
jgi:hypothetical protein